MTDLALPPSLAAGEQGAQPTIAQALAAFAAGTHADDIPAEVMTRAKYLVLDAVGIAHASTRYPFAQRALAAARDMSGSTGDHPVLAVATRLQWRDATLVNGILVHGLDYDDTHARSVVHATASCFPCALGVAAHAHRSARELLAAYVVGVEAAARLGAVAKGGFHQVGFHPTGVIGTFACALVAGRLLGLDASALAMAQGIALSVAAGSLEFLEDGAWTKRMHPGWAAVSGITAASLARHGFVGPRAAYEGRFGLFSSHLGAHAGAADLSLATAELGRTWEVANVSVKPIPACHFTHACADAAAALAARHGLRASDIRAVRALVPREVVTTVCEPVATKQRPQNSYDAQFSIPYVVATALVRGGFGLRDLEDDALGDPEVLALAQKVHYEIDPASPFPKHYSGEVIVTTHDGRELRQREEVHRGAADRPITNAEVERKFLENATLVVSPTRAEAIRDLVLGLDGDADARAIAEGLAGGDS